MKGRTKTVAQGKPLDNTPEELDMLAIVTIEDIEAAKADAAARMTPRGRALMDAARVELPPETNV